MALNTTDRGVCGKREKWKGDSFDGEGKVHLGKDVPMSSKFSFHLTFPLHIWWIADM